MMALALFDKVTRPGYRSKLARLTEIASSVAHRSLGSQELKSAERANAIRLRSQIIAVLSASGAPGP